MRSVRGSSKAWARLRAKKRPIKSEKTAKPKKQMACYVKRTKHLSFLGYGSYKEYLTSPEWKGIREKKLRRHKNCIMCALPATQVHHLSYDPHTLAGDRDHKLVQLCGRCHLSIEFKGTVKRRLKDANRVLFETALQTERGQRWKAWYDIQEGLYKAKVRRTRRRCRSQGKSQAFPKLSK